MTITEFLEARIAEDEACARQEDEDYADTTLLPTYDSEHQANWNTARVLAECAAKRAVLASLWVVGASNLKGDPVRCGMYSALSDVAMDLAAVHAAHPDYRQEWTQ